MSLNYSVPKEPPTNIVVACSKETSKEQLEELIQKKALKRVSPEEAVIGMVAAIARDIKAGTSKT